MPFVLILPLIVIGIVIATTRKAAEQNKRAEAQRRAAQMQHEAAVGGQATHSPVKPSVQATPVRRVEPTPTPRTVQKAYSSPLAKAQAHPEHEDCSLRPDAKAPQSPPWKHPQHDECSLDRETASKPEPYTVNPRNTALRGEGIHLDMTPDNIVRGVLFSEIFGKPKALR